MTDGSFAQALTGRGVARHRDTGHWPMNPDTGELIDLAEYAHQDLADLFLALQERERQFKEWRTLVEDELVRRHGDKRHAETVGDYEIDVDRGHTRVWDAEDLQTVLADLFARQLISVQDWADIVTEVPKVDGRKAANLLNRADGDALVELRRCFHWKQGRAKVKVTPVVSLEP